MPELKQPGCVRGQLVAVAMVGFGLYLQLTTMTVAQEIPATPSAPPPTVPASGLVGKCTSCFSSLGSIFSGCKQRCCNSPLGKLLNGAIQPLNFATGGLIPTPCPGPNDPAKKSPGDGAGESGKGPPGAQQAAEAIKQDQAQAKARAEAVRYLSTVDCHYYPEAEAALITALRTDRSECVRWEAAHALAQGCCCTKKTIKALKITAEGSQEDGNPSETSMRVRVEAINALQHCLAVHGGPIDGHQRPESSTGEPETIPTPPTSTRPESPSTDNDASGTAHTAGTVQLASYYEEVERRPAEDLLSEARRLVQEPQWAFATARKTHPGKSLFELWQHAKGPARAHVASTDADHLAGDTTNNRPNMVATWSHNPTPRSFDTESNKHVSELSRLSSSSATKWQPTVTQSNHTRPLDNPDAQPHFDSDVTPRATTLSPANSAIPPQTPPQLLWQSEQQAGFAERQHHPSIASYRADETDGPHGMRPFTRFERETPTGRVREMNDRLPPASPHHQIDLQSDEWLSPRYLTPSRSTTPSPSQPTAHWTQGGQIWP